MMSKYRNTLCKAKIATMLIIVATFFCLSSCFDNRFDLTDFDSTTRVEVHDLSLSLNVNNVTLGGVIKVDDGDKIQIVEDENGDSIFAVLVEGNFDSESVTIDDESIISTENVEIGDGTQLFTGEVEYKFGQFDIPDVDLSSLPSFLRGADTRIVLKNPQIYVELFNPLTRFGTWIEAGLKLSPIKGSYTGACETDNGRRLSTKPSERLSTYVLSPEKPKAILDGYNEPEFIQFSALKHILDTGKGVPERIGVEILEAMLPKQRVVDVPLKSTIGGIEGYYTFYVPLEFDEGTTIIYSDTIDGWGDEVKNHVGIRKLSISGNASLHIPVDETEVMVEPLCYDARNALSRSFTLHSGHPDEPFCLEFDYGDKPLEHLSKIVLKAKLPMRCGEVLKPSQSIELKDIKISVDGYYEK